MSIIVMLLLSIIILSCGSDNNPVNPQEEAYPSGIPDWNDSTFDWIDSTVIGELEYPKSPKWGISAFECSPDGKDLIIQVQTKSSNEILTFNLNSLGFTLLMNRIICNADWDSKGDLIGFGFNSINNRNEKYCIYNWKTKNYYYLPIPDTFTYFSCSFKWWDSDTTFLTWFKTTNDKISHTYLMNINPPYTIQIREDLSYDFESYKNYRYCFNHDSEPLKSNRILLIKNENNDILSSYELPGNTRATSVSQAISPDGKYLAFIASADMSGTKWYQLFYGNGMDNNLVIVKLDELNSGNIIYRMFPDYNNSRHWKFGNVDRNIGAWSADSKYFYHSYYLADSTVQIVKRNIYSGKVTFLTDLKSAP